MIKTLFKHRKKLAVITLAAMTIKSFGKDKQEDQEIIQAKKILENKGYKVSKTNKAMGSAKYVQQLYKENPQLVNQAVKLIRKFGNF